MKTTITIKTGKLNKYRERTFIFKTNEKINTNYFTTRKTLHAFNFPAHVKGDVQQLSDDSGIMWEWSDFAIADVSFWNELQVQNIISIHINNVDINQNIEAYAEAQGFKAVFPLIYHIQFTSEDVSQYVFNWYPTTGTLTRQIKNNIYSRVKKLRKTIDIDDVFEAIQKEL